MCVAADQSDAQLLPACKARVAHSLADATASLAEATLPLASVGICFAPCANGGTTRSPRNSSGVENRIILTAACGGGQGRRNLPVYIDVNESSVMCAASAHAVHDPRSLYKRHARGAGAVVAKALQDV